MDNPLEIDAGVTEVPVDPSNRKHVRPLPDLRKHGSATGGTPVPARCAQDPAPGVDNGCAQVS
ncbi:hypothetical protein TPA0906_37920 [Streptomyces olivaceus]|nr:hypothetical protein TPA0906_37920 [Streptomyces olivaceus]